MSFHSPVLFILPSMPQDKMGCRCLCPREYLVTLRNQGDLVIELVTLGVAGETKTPVTNS